MQSTLEILPQLGLRRPYREQRLYVDEKYALIILTLGEQLYMEHDIVWMPMQEVLQLGLSLSCYAPTEHATKVTR